MTAAANRGSARRGFASDNAATVHPEVLAAIAEANVGHAYGYGHDPLSERLGERFREHFGEEARAYPVWGGTAANVLCLRAACRPWEGAICASTAHLNVDECGAPEAIAGVKLLAVAGRGRKAHPGRRPAVDRADRRRARGPASRALDLPGHGARHALCPGGDPGAGRAGARARHAPARGRRAAGQRRCCAGHPAARDHRRRGGRPALLRRDQERPAGRRGGRLPGRRNRRGIRVPAQAVAAAGLEDALPLGPARRAADRRALAPQRLPCQRHGGPPGRAGA